MKRSCSCKRRIARLLGAEGNSNSNKHNRVVEQHHSVHNMLDLEAEASAENHTVCYVPQLRIQTEDTVKIVKLILMQHSDSHNVV